MDAAVFTPIVLRAWAGLTSVALPSQQTDSNPNKKKHRHANYQK